jgi:uncharacterized protein
MSQARSSSSMVIERNILIQLADGVSLASDLYLPDGPGPFPALISLYPYRKDDVIGSFTEYPRRYLVRRGYAHLLVDLRGYGGSEGASVESMDPRPEGADGAEVVEWAAAQAWCNGSVGVWGISYGGLAALATAAERPPSLRAIASIYGPWDIGRQAIAPGGVPFCLGRYLRECVMLAQELAPPTFQDEDGRWLRVWKARLKRLGAQGPHSLRWPVKVHDPAYWAERKIQLQRIEVPTFLVGGWRDLYPEATVRAYEEISSRRRLLVGPWLHAPPDLAEEPIDWLGELASFFDQQLGDASGGDEPPVTIFVQGGEWRDEREWPIARTTYRTWYPAPRGVLAAEQAHGVDDYSADPTVGARAGLLDPLGLGVGLPRDQGPDDLASLAYTSAPLPDELEITGSPAATLAVVAEGAAADLSVKLVDVGPDGRGSLVTSGRAHHSGKELVQVGLYATSYVIPEGHRLRLSIACADFPRFWPTPQSMRIRLELARSSLVLPIVPPALDRTPRAVPRPRQDSSRHGWAVGGAPHLRATEDLVKKRVSVTAGGWEELVLPDGGSLRIRHSGTAAVARARPAGAVVVASAQIDLHLPRGESVVVEARARVRRNRVAYSGRVRMDGELVLDRAWHSS